MDRFAALRAFVEVVNEGGFAAAARSLGNTRSGVSRLVLSLEQELSVQLLNRSTRGVSTTPDGSIFFDRAQKILLDLEEAERSVVQNKDNASGLLRVTSSLTLGALLLGRMVGQFMVQNPQIRVELELDERQTNIVNEGFDIAVRIGESGDDTSLVNRPIAELERILAAAPAYLAQHGEPQTPDELRQHRCISYSNLQAHNFWRLRGNGEQFNAHVNCVLTSNNGLALREAAIAGCGIIAEPKFIVADALRAGHLKQVLPAYEFPSLTLSIVSPANRFRQRKTQLFIDHLIENFPKDFDWK